MRHRNCKTFEGCTPPHRTGQQHLINDEKVEPYGATNNGTRNLDAQLIRIKRRDGARTLDRAEASEVARAIATKRGIRVSFYCSTTTYYVYQEVK